MVQIFERTKHQTILRRVCKILIWIGLLGLTILAEHIITNYTPILGYRVERTKLKSVIPRYYVFPGQKIRLTPEFPDGETFQKVVKLDWEVRKGSSQLLKKSGFHPTLILPPEEGGIYELRVFAEIRGERQIRKGAMSIYVVQDKPDSIRLKSNAKALLGHFPQLGPVGLTASNKLEWYSGNKSWTTAIDFDSRTGFATVPSGMPLAIRDGQIFYRILDKKNELQRYGAALLIPPKNNSSRGDSTKTSSSFKSFKKVSFEGFSMNIPKDWSASGTVFNDEDGHKIAELAPGLVFPKIPISAKEYIERRKKGGPDMNLREGWSMSFDEGDSPDFLKEQSLSLKERKWIYTLEKVYLDDPDDDHAFWFVHSYVATFSKKLFIINFYAFKQDPKKKDTYQKILSSVELTK